MDVIERFSARATGGRTASSLIAGFDDLTIDLFLRQCLRPVISRWFNRHVGRSNVWDNYDSNCYDQGDRQRGIFNESLQIARIANRSYCGRDKRRRYFSFYKDGYVG